MTTRRVWLTIAMALLTVPAAPRGQGQVPAREAQTGSAAEGTAEMTVIVSTDEQNSRPLRRVSVALQASQIELPRIAVTDDDGRAVFRRLPAGNYFLTASRQGFVRTYYGSRRPGAGPGVAVAVIDGQRVPDIRMRMLRGGVLAGVVRTPSGQPAVGVQVQAMMVKTAGGTRRAVNLENTLVSTGSSSTSTNDLGAFRMFGLAPGDYVILTPTFSIGSSELRPITAAELQWADAVVASGRSGAPPPSAAPAAVPAVTSAPVYYPGTATADEAVVITLGPAEERLGLDFSQRFVPTARISGRLVDESGRPQPNVSITLRNARPDALDIVSAIGSGIGRTLSDGSFTIASVRPGRYTLNARATPAGAAPPPPPAGGADPTAALMAAALGSSGGGGATHWAMEEVTVAGQDVGALTLTLRPGMTVTGRIAFDVSSRKPPEDLSRMALMLAPMPTAAGQVEQVVSMAAGSTTTAIITADGEFTIKGVTPGRYRLSSATSMVSAAAIAAAGGGWILKSVIVNGRDVSDLPLEIGPGGSVSGVVVTFTDRPTEVSGTVYDQAGRATPNFPIVVFSTDRAQWTVASRRVQLARPNSSGAYQIVGLPAGEYFVCAVTAVEDSDLYDAAFLEQLAAASFKITLKDAEKRTQDLKLGGG